MSFMHNLHSQKPTMRQDKKKSGGYKELNYYFVKHMACFQMGDVRLCCLRALYPLYETPDLCHKLEYFTNRFKVGKYG